MAFEQVDGVGSLMSNGPNAVKEMVNAVAAQLAHWQQTDRLLTLSIPGVAAGSQLVPETLCGIEVVGPLCRDDPFVPTRAMGSLQHADVHGFEWRLTVLSTDAQLKAADFIGQPALIELQTAQSRDERRPLHGVIQSFSHLAANGGLARYDVVIKPWLAMLNLRCDSYVFTDKTVFDILDDVFTDYQQGVLGEQVRWRHAIADRSVYATRSVTTQHDESDLMFLTRLLAEEGLCYFIEHSAEGHTVVITDDSTQFAANAQDTIRFTRSSASLREDSVDRWQVRHHVLPSRVVLSSWDYRGLSTRQVESTASGVSPQLVVQLEPGAYAYADMAQGQRLADGVMQSFNSRRQIVQARGTVRTLSPGSSFTLTDHYQAGTTPYAVIAVWHEARNNLQMHTGRGGDLVSKLLGKVSHAPSNSSEANAGSEDAVVEHYRNYFTALPRETLYRPASTLHGKALYARPTVQGTQTAVVVGLEDPVHTDRDHRVQIQYHWQRGVRSSSGLAHPAGEDNASGQSRGMDRGLWVRVATRDAGSNFGSVFVPRVGQEVVVGFVGRDIDRPVVLGAVYNGVGAKDAQYNQVSQGGAGATGNAPAWFAGDQGAHAHHAALSGIKTQALSQSQNGQGGYNQLVFDDTPAHGGLRLQTSQWSTQLNLGSLWHQRDNQRAAVRGYGAELITQQSGAIRGGSGVLISTDAASPGSEQLDSPARSLLQQSQGIGVALHQHAQQQRAELGIDAQQIEQQVLDSLCSKLSATQGAMSSSAGATASDSQAGIKDIGGGQGEVTSYSHPLMALSSPGGIASFSAENLFEVTGQHRLSVAADSNQLIRGSSIVHSGEGQRWYTSGQTPTTARGVAGTGIRLHAASGDIQLRSLTATTQISADGRIQIGSVERAVSLSAPTSTLMLTAGGAAITLKQGQLTLAAPGNITLSATQVIYTGPQSVSDSISLAKSQVKECAVATAQAASGSAV